MKIDVSTPDAELVLHARSGDDDAFRQLFLRHRSGVAAVCQQQLGAPGDVDDAVQETFARALARLHQLREPSTFGAWARSIATRICLDQHRVTNRVTVVHGDLALEVEDAAPSPHEVAETEERNASFRASLRELGARDRKALWLRHVSEAPVKVVADELGLTEGSTRVLLARARKRLRAAAGGIGVLVPWSWRNWLRSLTQTPNPAFDFAAVAVAMTIAATAGAAVAGKAEIPRGRDDTVVQTRSNEGRKAEAKERAAKRADRPVLKREASGPAPSPAPRRAQPVDGQRRDKVSSAPVVDVADKVNVRRDYPDQDESEEIADITVFTGDEEGGFRLYADDAEATMRQAESAVEVPLDAAP